MYDGRPPLEDILQDIPMNTTVYAVPWALDATTGELNLRYSYTTTPQGTSSMPVTRTEKGFKCDTKFDYFGEQYKWSR